MKEKRTYSLTAKERKARRAGQVKSRKEEETVKPSVDYTEVRAAQEGAMIASQKHSRSTALIVGAVVAVAIILILAAILVPVISYLINPYRNYKNVVARFNLSNGMVLEFAIDEDKYDIAATNFIFLANSGYFDNTVLFDAQNGYIRFGGYEEQPRLASSTTDYENTRHHAQNKTYCENFSALPTDRFRDGNVSYKFGYKLYADKEGETESIRHQFGTLTYLYSDTSTEFQMAYSDMPVDNIDRRESGGGTSTKELKSTMVGYALDGPDGATVNNLIEISKLAVERSNVTYGYMWKPPTPNIYISSVKVYNLDSAKWRDFSFIDYMMSNGSSGSRRMNYYTGLITN